MHNVRVGDAVLDLKLRRTVDRIVLEARNIASVAGSGEYSVEFSPAVSLRAVVSGAEIDGSRAPVRSERNSQDQHATVVFQVGPTPSTVSIHVRNDFGVDVLSELPDHGERSEGLRMISTAWGAKNKTLSLQIAGVPGKDYALTLWNPAQVASVDGAELVTDVGQDGNWIRVKLPGTGSSYVHSKIAFHFLDESGGRGTQKTRQKGTGAKHRP